MAERVIERLRGFKDVQEWLEAFIWSHKFVGKGETDFCKMAEVALDLINSLTRENGLHQADISILRTNLSTAVSKTSAALLENTRLTRELAEARSRYTRVRAFAARNMHGADDPEYPMSKADLRNALRDASEALRKIAIDAASTQETP